MRRCALILKLNRITIDRKLIYLAKKAKLSHQKFLSEQKCLVTHMQFDDLITSEHTKLKPLTVSIAVDADKRTILAAEVAQIGAFGKLAELSRKKYGRRINRHNESLRRMFVTVEGSVHPHAMIESDEHYKYAAFVAEFFPQSKYIQYKGGRACVAGQGEIKKGGFDPIFTMNHSCAMFRGDVNRLIRRTWCTSKKAERLQMHLNLFIEFYNQYYLPKVAPHKWGS